MDNIEKKIGIIGGGQLGKMMILEAKKLDFHISILDPTADCPAHSISDEHIVAEFDDEVAIRKLAESVDVVTYEFEHIGVETLLELENEGYIIYPTAKSLQIIQNKFTQKKQLKSEGIPVPEFSEVNSIDDIYKNGEVFGYPMLLKSCYGGYDGKGNRVIIDKDDVVAGYEGLNGDTNKLMIEKFVDFKSEISVIAARDVDGKIVTFPIGENIHKDNILEKTIVPANITNEEHDQAEKIANEVLDCFKGIGIFCIEMFVTNDGSVMVNEIAPRPHNSGHYTIEACVTSQFEQHIRAISGLPLGETRLIQHAIMTNILGDRGPQIASYVGIDEAMEMPGVNPHIYGKTMVKPGRKMGHITTIGDVLSDIEEKADKARRLIEFKEKSP